MARRHRASAQTTHRAVPSRPRRAPPRASCAGCPASSSPTAGSRSESTTGVRGSSEWDRWPTCPPGRSRPSSTASATGRRRPSTSARARSNRHRDRRAAAVSTPDASMMSVGRVGTRRRSGERQHHAVHQQAHRPDAAADDREELEALDLVGDDVIGKARRGRAADRRRGTDRCRQAWGNNSHDIVTIIRVQSTRNELPLSMNLNVKRPWLRSACFLTSFSTLTMCAIAACFLVMP